MSTALPGLPAGWSGTRVTSTGSTNADLLTAARAGAPHATVLAADEQTAGRGRLGRRWVTPAGSALAVSVLLRPTVDRACWTWLPLLTGLAVADALATLTPTLDVVLKWPNDVLVVAAAGELKLAGILVEQAGSGTGAVSAIGGTNPTGGSPGAVVVGIGLNVTVPADAFPPDARATSLTAALAAAHAAVREVESGTTAHAGGGPGTVPDRDQVLTGVLRALALRYSAWSSAAGPADPSGGLAGDYLARCATLGRRVRVERAGAAPVEGVASGIGADGALVVDRPDGGRPVTVHAGDVRHLQVVPGTADD